MEQKASGKESGSFGPVSYEGNTITITIDANSLGAIAVTFPVGRIECFWDGTKWVCNSISFGTQGD